MLASAPNTSPLRAELDSCRPVDCGQTRRAPVPSSIAVGTGGFADPSFRLTPSPLPPGALVKFHAFVHLGDTDGSGHPEQVLHRRPQPVSCHARRNSGPHPVGIPLGQTEHMSVGMLQIHISPAVAGADRTHDCEHVACQRVYR
jgi:hypothetical protein